MSSPWPRPPPVGRVAFLLVLSVPVPDVWGGLLNEHGRNELGAFLRSRRERVDPASAGLPPSGRRRTPGLRREEVSLLSGVSLTWYTWLEQGRDMRVSAQVLMALARVLRLDEVEHAHLFRLAGLPQPRRERPTELPSGVREFLDHLDPSPAFLIDRCFDILAWNRAQAALLGPLLERPARERNTVWQLFLVPQLRELMPEWDAEARWLVGLLRQQAAYETENPRFEELVSELLSASADFARMWAAHDVTEFRSSVRRYRHPALGEVELTYVRLAVTEAPWLSVICHFAAPGSETEARLRARITPPEST
ncbi:helix-turn-helix transcriptional regulator [Streptomyces sp. UC4497]